MIARQRQNLALTFAAAELAEVSQADRARLLTYQREILDATVEFAAGLAQRGRPVPALDAAAGAMREAVAALEAGSPPPAVAAEQQAVNHLIRARRNIRQMLTPPSSQSAAACRKFDRQQKQKLRTPQQKEQDRQQQLAQCRSQLDDLAQRQRQWSEELRPSSGAQQPQDQQPRQDGEQPPQSGQQPSPSQGAPSSSSAQQSGSSGQEAHAAQQQQMLAELQALEQQLDSLEGASPSAREQAGRAEQSVQSSLEQLGRRNSDAAADDAERAAEQLEQTSDHLAAMNSSDFGQRLEHARHLAGRLADRQGDVEQQLADGAPTPERLADLARRQSDLAGQTDMLAELLAGLRADTLGLDPAVASGLESLRQSAPPHQIASQMRVAAEELAAGRAHEAQSDVAAARAGLDELAQGLAQLRGQYAQPQLDDLVALEEELARFTDQLARGAAGTDPQALEAQWQDLQDRLDALAQGDRRLARALDDLRQSARDADQAGVGPLVDGPGGGVPPGLRWLAAGNVVGLRQVSRALQAKIQEAILAGALLDADEPVPPEYQELVEEYYRSLSDDLR